MVRWCCFCVFVLSVTPSLVEAGWLSDLFNFGQSSRQDYSTHEDYYYDEPLQHYHHSTGYGHHQALKIRDEPETDPSPNFLPWLLSIPLLLAPFFSPFTIVSFGVSSTPYKACLSSSQSLIFQNCLCSGNGMSSRQVMNATGSVNATGNNGICRTAEECSNAGGRNIGSCASGFGVCCQGKPNGRGMVTAGQIDSIFCNSCNRWSHAYDA